MTKVFVSGIADGNHPCLTTPPSSSMVDCPLMLYAVPAFPDRDEFDRWDMYLQDPNEPLYIKPIGTIQYTYKQDTVYFNPPPAFYNGKATFWIAYAYAKLKTIPPEPPTNGNGEPPTNGNGNGGNGDVEFAFILIIAVLLLGLVFLGSDRL